ncbi:MAG TPA: hypothetical protein VGQ68_01280 [Gaiellaceae bacterium]|jgi:hypothetical protein|nr:hypothetical protein [Gaiellaceae bacterium]
MQSVSHISPQRGSALPSAEIQTLLREVERYLLAVELFRLEGCEPRWASET